MSEGRGRVHGDAWHAVAPAHHPRMGFRWLTPPAPAAIAMVRTPALAELLDRPLPNQGAARFARLMTADGAAVDEVVVARIAIDTIEVMCHGGPGVRQAVTRCLAGHGVVEDGVEDGDARWCRLAAAPSPSAARWLLAHGDATPPFPAAFLVRPPLILITGPANAGKSTLLNAWCGHARALVADLPGTTRDLVAADVDADGWRLRLIDSAGLRPTDETIEAAGQELARSARNGADLVLTLDPVDTAMAAESRPGDVIVAARADLGPARRRHDALWSARGVIGRDATRLLDDLRRTVLTRLGLAGPG